MRPVNGLGWDRMSVRSVTVRSMLALFSVMTLFFRSVLYQGLEWALGARVELSEIAAFTGRGLAMVKCLRPRVYVSEHKSIFTLNYTASGQLSLGSEVLCKLTSCVPLVFSFR